MQQKPQASQEILDRVAAMLEELQGPEEPLPPPRRRAPMLHGRSLAVAVLAGAGLLLVALVAVIARGDEPSEQANERDASSSGSCAAELEFQDTLYVGTSLNGLRVTTGDRLGTGTRPACGGPVTVDNELQTTTVEQVPSQDVPVFALEGIDPSVAIGRSDKPDAIYLAPWRCFGYARAIEFERCLRSPLEYGGEIYVGTKSPVQLAQGSPLGEGTRPACCGRLAESQPVVAIDGVNPRVAVGVAGEPDAVYVARSRCMVPTREEFLQCLRS
jgi:hypothetical protein